MNPLLRESSAHVFVDDISCPELHDDDLRHLTKSLRLKDGESVSVSDGAGKWRMCTFRTNAGLEIVGDLFTENVPMPELTIALSPVKSDRTDLAVEKMTEIGIDTVMVLSPLRRSVVRWDNEKARHHVERLSRIARNASMQSRRVFLPKIVGPISLKEALSLPDAAVADPEGDVDIAQCSVVVIGPEGGFDAEERESAPVLVGLGGSVLRAETAAIVAATLMVAHRGRHSDHTG